MTLDLSTLSVDDLRRLACEVAGIEPDGWIPAWKAARMASRMEGPPCVLDLKGDAVAGDVPVYPPVESDPDSCAGLKRAFLGEDGLSSRAEIVYFGCGWKARVSLFSRGMTNWERANTEEMAFARAVVAYGVDAGLAKLPEVA